MRYSTVIQTAIQLHIEVKARQRLVHTKYHAMKTYGGCRFTAPLFLDLVIRCEWPHSRPVLSTIEKASRLVKAWNPSKIQPEAASSRSGGNVLGSQTGLWSTEAKVWGIVPKAVWHWGGDSSVENELFGAPDSTPTYVCLQPIWGSAGGDCLIPRFLWG
jgi:hypothetical protein